MAATSNLLTLKDITVAIHKRPQYVWFRVFSSEIDKKQYQAGINKRAIKPALCDNCQLVQFKVTTKTMDGITTGNPTEFQLQTQTGLIFGMFSGLKQILPSGKQTIDSNRIKVMAFDLTTRIWRTYHGPYLNWAKTVLHCCCLS